MGGRPRTEHVKASLWVTGTFAGPRWIDEICTSGSTSGDWKRSYGVASGAPRTERRGHSDVTPIATAPVVDSTGRTATVRDQTAQGEKAEQSEAARSVKCVGRSFGERPKDLHLDGAVRQPFFLAT
jgi:hypothetical protein